MADDDQPERILQTAIAFYKVQQILKKKTPDDHDEGVALTLTICLLQALTSELLLPAWPGRATARIGSCTIPSTIRSARSRARCVRVYRCA